MESGVVETAAAIAAMSAKFVGVTGLPRAGSTLLCQLLAQHPGFIAKVTARRCAIRCWAFGA
jgi:hypothetical protein